MLFRILIGCKWDRDKSVRWLVGCEVYRQEPTLKVHLPVLPVHLLVSSQSCYTQEGYNSK